MAAEPWRQPVGYLPAGKANKRPGSPSCVTGSSDLCLTVSLPAAFASYMSASPAASSSSTDVGGSTNEARPMLQVAAPARANDSPSRCTRRNASDEPVSGGSGARGPGDAHHRHEVQDAEDQSWIGDLVEPADGEHACQTGGHDESVGEVGEALRHGAQHGRLGVAHTGGSGAASRSVVAARNASTTAGSNWLPALWRSSSSAASSLRRSRYGRSDVMAW